MSAATPLRYDVAARNLSHASENKIHDDTVARALGFSAGLVPGAEVLAYACHTVVGYWGRAWFERGEVSCRFNKPVYDGHRCRVTARPTDGSLELAVESDGVLCA